MRPILRIAALSLATTVTLAPMARAQGAPPDGVPGDPEAFEQAEGAPAMHDDLDGFEPGRGGPGRFARRGLGAPGMRGGRGFEGRGFGPRLEAMRELDLTDAQRDRLADIREQHLKAAIPIEADLRLAELELGKLTRAERPDLRALERQIDHISGLRASLMKNRMSGMLEARSVLTPVQHRKLRELREQGPARPDSPREVPGGGRRRSG